MKTFRTAVLAAALIAASVGGAIAHDLTDVSRTQSRQIDEIAKARNTGQLTRREYSQLMA